MIYMPDESFYIDSFKFVIQLRENLNIPADCCSRVDPLRGDKKFTGVTKIFYRVILFTP